MTARTEPGVTAALAAFVAGHPAGAISEDVRERAERSILDTLACILAGSASEETEPLLHWLRAEAASGPAPVFGTDLRTTPALAALANGTSGHALDFDDVLSIMPAHPSTVILPALLACAPADTTGRDLIDAYVIGVEVGARIGVAITNGHYRRGWHATGTLAIFSAVAGLGRLLGLSAPQITRAFGIAGSMASGLQCNFGTMVKPFHAGWAAHNAVTAIGLACHGMSASETLFEAHAGFFETYGDERSAPARILATPDAPFALVSPGLALKKYPCCYALHRAIDALLDIRRRRKVDPDTVESVICRVAPGALRPLIYSDPQSGLEAKFSMDYVLAIGILDGRFDLAAFEDAGPKRPELRALLSRVSKIEDPRCLGDEADPGLRSAGTIGFVEVTVTFRDGTTEVARIDRPSGAPGKDLSADDLAAKFRDCATAAGMTQAATEAALTGWSGLRDARRIAPLLTFLTRSKS